ncbi:hypothetical protein [Runella slithyformis]|uniref:Uncharacterized protein n=1 Tax=Runella slithyformis (strain ATCC 29530 / DSM 19594 / LMG 11500 / NCIMB 11436 / LSU 4) TaxID=761193 RepID=A0A7U3ZNA7_RUNSL|nr:hypothetical protein [Runella slithyformis]AEI50375.1 hypothetical protein Runsl_4022 [Runella slithyformis DSM 19594]
MDHKILTSKQYFKFLLLVYGVMLVAQVGTGTVFFFLRSAQLNAMSNEATLNKLFTYLVPGIALVLPLLGIVLAKRTIKEMEISDLLSDKLRKYQSTLIFKYAFFEAATIFSLGAYFLTGELRYLGVAGAPVLLFLTQLPTRRRVFSEVPLSTLDKTQLNNPDAEVAQIPVKD